MKLVLVWIFEKYGVGVVVDFEIDFFFVWIDLYVQVFVEYVVVIVVGVGGVVVGVECGVDFVDLQEVVYYFVVGVDFEYVVGVGLVLDFLVEFVLLFLGVSCCE